MKKTEILAPAGDIRSLKAAFEAGTDAVYFGLSEFNARIRAENIDISRLPSIVSEAYLRGIKLYLTVNTLVKSDEIPAFLSLIDKAMISGITSFIIQDYGVLYLLEKYYPEAEIHISTQAATHLEGQIDFFSGSAVSRINLSRELPIKDVCSLTSYAHEKGIETEVFVHGSYCISYSGQCYLSSFLEGLSGNRGQCAQLCRRKYKDNSGSGYFLNLRDNSAAGFALTLLSCGVDSFKIEGRIKGPDYVYASVKTWKCLINSSENDSCTSSENHIKNLESVFNRGFTSGYLKDKITDDMFSVNPSDSSYIKTAEVKSYNADKKILETDDLYEPDLPSGVMVKNRDGVFVCCGILTESAGDCKYYFKIDGKLRGKINNGDILYSRENRLYTSVIERGINDNELKKIPVRLSVFCQEGERLSLAISHQSKGITAYSDDPVVKAEKKASGKDDFIKQLRRFGNTPLEAEEIIFTGWDEGVFIPASIVNRLRRKAVSLFLETIDEGRCDAVLSSLMHSPVKKADPEKSDIAVIVDNPELGKFISDAEHCEVFYDLSDPASSVDSRFIPLFPAVMDSGYAETLTERIREGEFCKIGANNTAMLAAASLSRTEWIAGSSLNITNHLAVEFFSRHEGFCGSFISSELGRDDIASLSGKTDSRLYFPLFERARLMTTRQCLLKYRCGRKESGEICFSSSCGNTVLTDVKGKKIVIEKRGYRYTEIYDSRYFFPYEASDDFKDSGLVFVIDLRLFSSSSADKKSVDKKISEFYSFLKLIRDPGYEDSFLETLKKNSFKGNYLRGLI